MIYRDDKGYPTDKSGDPGDSCVRAGILNMCGYIDTSLADYEVKPGYAARHPTHEIWSNENNYTRDQLMCLLGGLKTTGQIDIARRLFWSHFKRAFFTQSIDRDKRGSRKMLWPHSNWKDSNPTVDTFPMQWSWRELRFIPIIKTVLVAENKLYIAEDRLADGPDPLFPNHMGAIIIAGRMWYLYPLLLIAYPVHLLFLILHSRSKHFEENQQIAECSIFGTKKILKLLKPHWEANSLKYWQDRNEIEYHRMLVEFMK